MSKSMRELVAEEYTRQHDWRNKAVLYDCPETLPDISLMLDEELWTAFLQINNTGPIG